MIAKSKILISVFAALFLLLLGIQVYFMYKTYQVKERDIYRSVNDGLTNYTDNLEDLQEVKERNDDSLQKIIIRYHNKEISKKDFLRYFIENRKSARERLIHYINSRYQKDGYEISARIRYLSIIHLPDSTKVITEPISIFETPDVIKNPRIASNGSWETSTTKRDDTEKGQVEKKDTFLVKTQTDFEIRNIKSIV